MGVGGRDATLPITNAPFPCGVNRTCPPCAIKQATNTWLTLKRAITPEFCNALVCSLACRRLNLSAFAILVPFPVCFRRADAAWQPLPPSLLLYSVEQSSAGPEFHARRLYLLRYRLRPITPDLCGQPSCLAVVCCLRKLAVGKSCGGGF